MIIWSNYMADGKVLKLIYQTVSPPNNQLKHLHFKKF